MASAQEPPPSNAEDVFRLLDLPDEIWARIVRYAVGSTQPIRLRPKGYPQPQTYQPALARVCKIIREEALPSFYGNTIYYYDSWTYRDYSFMAWLRSIPPWCKVHLSNTFIILDDDDVDRELEFFEEVVRDEGVGVVYEGVGDEYWCGRLRVVKQGQS
ncbi:hypothetical protein LTR97_011491 [Elasticomyces elasticus]|uniref:Uncharacterized protein n=1 Tax=Elasticomyces elasticus TaxID=574655 RepID=A0AAN7VY95_9PEZI|nr:hypothetical protein LTR97_011491 [Elasticomyces elasticus]